MAEKFTEAGKLGRDIRSSLASAYEKAKRGVKSGYDYINDFVTEYGQEPLLNLYPQAVNLFAAGGEAVAGAFDKPADLGRYPYYDLPTRFDGASKASAQSVDSDEIQEDIPTITVSKKPRSSNLWRVMTEGGDRTKDAFYDNEKEAKEAFEKGGGKGVVMGLTIPEENQSQLKEQYIQNVRENWGADTNRKSKAKPESPETEEEFLYQQITRLNPNATEDQKRTYVERLSASRAKRREREGFSDEYAARLARGTLPTEYEQRRMGEESSARRMRDFITSTRIKDETAREMDREYRDEMRYLKAIERDSRRGGDYGRALQSRRAISQLNDIYGISSQDRGNRMRRFQEIAADEIRRKIKERDEERKFILKQQTTANPEAA